jgi:hypothetical protein
MVRDLPDEYTFTFEAKGVFNIMKNRFEDLGGTTRWTAESEFIFSGYMKLVALFMGGAFRKETMKTLQDFKSFAEAQASAKPEHVM